MVNISQEQKELIEKAGCLVVQVKAAIRKIKEFVYKIGRKIAELVERMQKIIEPEMMMQIEPRTRYKIVKKLGLNYSVYFNHKGFYRCRNNC